MNCPTCKATRHVLHLKIDPLEGEYAVIQPLPPYHVTKKRDGHYVIEGQGQRVQLRGKDAMDQARTVCAAMNEAHRAGFLVGRFQSVIQGELWGVQKIEGGAA